jgi:hypothetical protein
VAALIVAAGLLLALAGGRLAKAFAFVSGGLAGFDAARSALSQTGCSVSVFWVVVVAAALVAGILSLLLLRITLAAAGFGAGWFLCGLFRPELAYCTAAGVILALLCIIFHRHALAFLAASCGAAAAASGLAILLSRTGVPWIGAICICSGALVFTTGMLVQLRRRD